MHDIDESIIAGAGGGVAKADGDGRPQTVAERKYNPFGASPPRPAIAESAEDYEKRVRQMQEARFTAAVSGGCCGC